MSDQDTGIICFSNYNIFDCPLSERFTACDVTKSSRQPFFTLVARGNRVDDRLICFKHPIDEIIRRFAR